MAISKRMRGRNRSRRKISGHTVMVDVHFRLIGRKKPTMARMIRMVTLLTSNSCYLRKREQIFQNDHPRENAFFACTSPLDARYMAITSSRM